MMRIDDAIAYHARVLGEPLPAPVPIEKLAAHAEQLASDFSITWQKIGYRSFAAYPHTRRIVAPAIRSEEDYCAVLHELGHNESLEAERHGKDFTSEFLGQRSHINTSGESASWTWAKNHAITWTPAMEREKRRALGTYKRYAAYGLNDRIWRELDRIDNRLTVGHAFVMMQRRAMIDRRALIDDWRRDVARQEAASPIRKYQKLVERWKRETL